jgi:hypothetical protein
MKWFTMMLCSMSLVGCAAFQEGLRNAQQGGADPNMAAIAQGTGWFCYIASDKGWSACGRTVEECKEDRQKFQKEAMSKMLFAIKFGDCMSAVQASCTTHDELKMQSNGSAAPESFADCMPDQMSCESFKEELQKDSKNLRVSKCVDVK